MEFEFDKEIDAILRRARAGEVATSGSAHLDADEISAFAENAVSETARGRYTSHLADCTRCRKILSNTILLNSEAETETASSVVSAAVVETKTPWYRKFFVFPQLAYTMGGLVLLFSGFFGYLILKNLPAADRAVSYSTENRAVAEKPAPQAASNAASNSNTTSTTTTNSSSTAIPSAPSNASSSANSTPLSAANTTTAATPAADEKALAPELNSPVAVPEATPLSKAKPQDNPFIVDGSELSKTKNSPAPPSAAGTATTQNRAKEEKQKKDTDDTALADNEKAEEEASQQKSAPLPKSARKLPSKAGETRSVGGKTFNNVGGIWFDSAYGKQKQKSVRRGTEEYLRLDSGLRSIADNLGGTVVIVWGGKAYRVQ
jgi:hypothetical protein